MQHLPAMASFALQLEPARGAQPFPNARLGSMSAKVSRLCFDAFDLPAGMMPDPSHRS
jgi:hypothetical protein